MSTLFPHPRKQLLFALLSLADLVLTWWLIGHGGGRVYEANPVAGWLLGRYGWLGLACFKSMIVLVVLTLVAVISSFHPRAGGRALLLGCAVLALVVSYSTALCREVTRVPANEQAKAREENRWQKEDCRRLAAKHRRKAALLREVRQGLRSGRCTLCEAVNRLACSELGHDPAWVRSLAHLHPQGDLDARIAAFVIVHVVGTLKDQQEARDMALRLEEEFLHLYGPKWPRTHRRLLRAPGPGCPRPVGVEFRKMTRRAAVFAPFRDCYYNRRARWLATKQKTATTFSFRREAETPSPWASCWSATALT